MGEPAGIADDVTAPLELAHYAWVTAALAEGFGLDEVLALEGLEPEIWRQAELSWRTRLATDLDIHDDYRSHLAHAEDELGGQVTPLDDDLKAWVVFLRVYGDHPAPFELLAEQKLRPGDLARLHRKWARRLEADDDLVEQAEKLREKTAGRAEDGEQLPLPDISVVPGSLCASPHARALPPQADEPTAAAAQPAAPVATSSGSDLSLYDYAALCAALDDEGVDRAAVLQAHGLSLEGGDRLERVWRARMDADPALAADFRNLHRHFNEREGLRGGSGALAKHEIDPGSPQPFAPPVAAVVAPPSAGPWSGPAAEPPESPTPSPEPVAAEPALGYNRSLGMTMDGVDPHPRVILPFGAKAGADSAGGAASSAKSADSEHPPARAATKSEPPAPSPDATASERRRNYNPDLGQTAAVGQKVPKLTLPFRVRQLLDASKSGAKDSEPPPAEPHPSEPSQPSEPPAPAAGSAAAPKSAGYNKDLARTAKVGAKVPKITLPFRAETGADSSQPDEPGPPKRLERPAPEQRSDYNPDLGKTAAVGGRVPLVTLPFQGKRLADAVRAATKRDARGAGRSSAAEQPAATPSSPPPARSSQPAGAPVGGSQDDGDLSKQVAGWKVNHYASLCAELAEHPERVDAIHARYGLRNEAAEQYVHELWQMRFVEDDDARREWQRLLKKYRESLAKKK